METLKKQTEYFENNIATLLKQYDGKVLIISSDLKVNAFPSFETAYMFGVGNYGLGNFLMRECKQEEIGKVHFITPYIVRV